MFDSHKNAVYLSTHVVVLVNYALGAFRPETEKRIKCAHEDIYEKMLLSVSPISHKFSWILLTLSLKVQSCEDLK